jgi:uncharacterized protein (DUF885 family)
VAGAALVDRFVIRAFHDVVLWQGAVALSTVRSLLVTWLADGASRTGADPDGPPARE